MARGIATASPIGNVIYLSFAAKWVLDFVQIRPTTEQNFLDAVNDSPLSSTLTSEIIATFDELVTLCVIHQNKHGFYFLAGEADSKEFGKD